jgi:hypothetical protein
VLWFIIVKGYKGLGEEVIGVNYGYGCNISLLCTIDVTFSYGHLCASDPIHFMIDRFDYGA